MHHEIPCETLEKTKPASAVERAAKRVAVDTTGRCFHHLTRSVRLTLPPPFLHRRLVASLLDRLLLSDAQAAAPKPAPELTPWRPQGPAAQAERLHGGWKLKEAERGLSRWNEHQKYFGEALHLRSLHLPPIDTYRCTEMGRDEPLQLPDGSGRILRGIYIIYSFRSL